MKVSVQNPRLASMLAKANMTMGAAKKAMDLFHLPIRVDMLGSVPPDIEVIEPSSISKLELHVPKGDVEVYSKHHQWKRAFLITDDNGAIFFSNPKNAARYEDDLAQKTKEKEEILRAYEERKQRAIEEAKTEKLKQMQTVSHEALCRQLLAAYQPEFARNALNDTYEVKVTLKSGLKLAFDMKAEDCPVTIWQELLKYIEQYDNIFGQALGSKNEVKLTMNVH